MVFCFASGGATFFSLVKYKPGFVVRDTTVTPPQLKCVPEVQHDLMKEQSVKRQKSTFMRSVKWPQCC